MLWKWVYIFWKVVIHKYLLHLLLTLPFINFMYEFRKKERFKIIQHEITTFELLCLIKYFFLNPAFSSFFFVVFFHPYSIHLLFSWEWICAGLVKMLSKLDVFLYFILLLQSFSKCCTLYLEDRFWVILFILFYYFYITGTGVYL